MRVKSYPKLKLEGAAALDGTRYIAIVHQGEEWLAPHKVLLTDAAQAFQSLAEQGMPIGGRSFIAQLQAEIDQITDFPKREILREPGWNGPIYARADGEALLPNAAVQSGDTPAIGFPRHPDRYSCAGSLKTWKDTVAALLLTDPLLTLLVGLALAPVARSLSSRSIPPVACQVVAERHCNTIRRVALSTVGSMSAGSLESDSIEKLLRAPDHYIEAARDNLLVLGDVAGYLAGGSDKKRLAAVRSLVFDRLLPTGGGHLNAVGKPAPSFIVVENRPLAELLSLESVAANRLNQQVPLINAPRCTFDRLSYHGDLHGQAAWRDAINTMTECYGHPLLAFQRGLVEERSETGAVSAQESLDEDLAEFWSYARNRVPDDELADDLIHPFALGYAALVAAQRIRVIPKSKTRKSIFGSAFNGFASNHSPVASAAKVLRAIASDPGVLHIDRIDKSLGKQDLQKVPAFIKTFGHDKRELWVTTAHKKDTFDWLTFRKLPDFDEFYLGKGERDREGGKRVIGGWKDARVLRFRLP